MRESRSAAVQGPAVPTENNVLTDGTLIDLCGATLLWRSTEGIHFLLLLFSDFEQKQSKYGGYGGNSDEQARSSLERENVGNGGKTFENKTKKIKDSKLWYVAWQ